jgi:hypothetical protein
MRRRYFRLSALLVATLMVVSLGATSALADDNVQPVEIKFQGSNVKHRSTFEISFSGFAAFFRSVYQRTSVFTPVSAPPPAAFEPIDDAYDVPVFWLGKPGDKNDPNEVPTQGPGISDSADPII